MGARSSLMEAIACGLLQCLVTEVSGAAGVMYSISLVPKPSKFFLVLILVTRCHFNGTQIDQHDAHIRTCNRVSCSQ